MNLELEQKLELGKKSAYAASYKADVLFPIPRAGKRSEIGIHSKEQIPFWGYDVLNHYEVSWLNPKGKPLVATAEILYDCHSSHIIESKSLKLYFNSFNNTHFASIGALEETIIRDLQNLIDTQVWVTIKQLGTPLSNQLHESFSGECIDHLDVSCSVYSVDPGLLAIEHEQVEETLYSDLLKSNCLVTFQPDWGSVQISYKGSKINREALLQYLVSFRNHNEFHEQCIERIFMDLMTHCKPEKLTVYGRFTRRGGLDINPYRSTEQPELAAKNLRLIRQ